MGHRGHLFGMVQVPLFYQDSVICVYWGMAGDTVPEHTTNGATWSESFIAVWHMTNAWVQDAACKGNNASEVYQGATGVSPITNVAGPVGNALCFNGSGVDQGCYIRTTNIRLTNETLSAWVWGDDVSAAIPCAGSWHYVVGTADGGGAYAGRYQKLYVDGEQKSSWTKTTIPAQNDDRIHIGGQWPNDRNLKGRLDECRMANVPRSPERIWAEYYNQLGPTTFATYGAVPEPSAAVAVALVFLLAARKRAGRGN